MIAQQLYWLTLQELYDSLISQKWLTLNHKIVCQKNSQVHLTPQIIDIHTLSGGIITAEQDNKLVETATRSSRSKSCS